MAAGLYRFRSMAQAGGTGGEISLSVLAIFGGADEHISKSDAQQFDAALGKASVEHWMVTCDGAPHGFVDRRAAEFPVAAETAWRRIRAFIGGLTPVFE